MTKKTLLKKALSVFTAMAMMLSLMTGIPFSELGLGITVSAEESTSTLLSVTAFATPEQLMSSDNFALHTDTGSGTAQKVYFGTNGNSQQTWYIAGSDADNSIVLLCDPILPMTTGCFDDKSDLVDTDYKTYDNNWNCTYGTAPSRVYANHYGASDLRLITFPNLESSAFSTSEQDMMLATKVYTDDDMLRDEHNSEKTYYTTDKLYAAYGVYEEAIITVGENSADSLNSGLKVSLTSGPYTNDDVTKFYLRTPYLDQKLSVHYVSPSADKVGCVSVKMNTAQYAVVPAFRLNLSSVLFASAAPAATSAASLTDTMTFRVDGKNEIKSEASYITDGVYVDVAEEETVYLYVQGNDGTNDWVYSQKISEDGLVEPSSIMAGAKNANGATINLSTLDLSQCKIWLEKSDNNLAYAVIVHIHEWEYSASDDTITAVCVADDCPVTGTNTIVISASDKTYDGTAVIASLDNKINSEDYNSNIVYTAEDGGSLTDGKPINVGTYTASFTHEGATASVEFTIEKATLTAEMFAYTESDVYDGTEKSASVSTDKVGMGEITVKYYQNNKQVTPVNAGIYTVKIDVAAGDNYNAIKGLEVGTFEITKVTPTVTAPTANENLIYTGKAQKLVTAGSTNGGKIQYSLEEDGTYSTAIPTGKNAGEYTVWYKVVGDSNVNDVAAQSVNVTIAKAPLTITANSHTIKVGTALPVYDYIVAGLVGDDTLPVEVTAACTAADSNTAGTYNITVSCDVTPENYNITYIKGTLTITDKDIQEIKVDNITLTYGDEPVTLNATTTGDGAITYRLITSNGSITLDGNNKVTLNKSGTATIEITASETDKYAEAVKTISITVKKAAVTITAKSHTVKKGDAMPELTYTVTGLVNNDTLAETPVITCAAADTNKTGSFDIVVNYPKSEDDKYTYSIKNGKLTVKSSSSNSSGGGYSGGGSSREPIPDSLPEVGGKSTTWSAIANEIEELPVGGEYTLDLNGNIDVPMDVINAIIKSGAKVTVVVKDDFSCVIDGAKITEKMYKDFYIYITGSINTSRLRGTAGLNFRISGGDLPVEIVANFDKKHAGKFANLFVKKDGDLVFVDNVKVDENGKATITVTEAGYYAIMLCEYSDRPGDLSNDGVITADDSTALLKNITALAKSVNSEVADYNGDGRVNALDASAILIDLKSGKIKTTI